MDIKTWIWSLQKNAEEMMYYTLPKISSDISGFLQISTQHELRFPNESLPLLFDICTQLQVSTPININIDINVKYVSPKPRIHFKRRKDKLDVHLEIWIENFECYEISKGPKILL